MPHRKVGLGLIFGLNNLKNNNMSEFKGTKGKWKTIKHSDSDTLFYVNNEELRMGNIATCYGIGTTKESFYNAKLIASAPEMLEMLIKLNSFCTMKVEDRSKLEQLLTKITE